MFKFRISVIFASFFVSALVASGATPESVILAEECGFAEEIGRATLDGPIEAMAPFHSVGCRGAYATIRDATGRLELVRWDEHSDHAWRRGLEFPVFISLSASANGELVAACTWEDESVLGFVFDGNGTLRERRRLDPFEQIRVLPDGSDYSVTWAMFDWFARPQSEQPAVALSAECVGGRWDMKPLASGHTLWWYHPQQHPSEVIGARCYPAFALTGDDGRLLFDEQEDASFVTSFADAVCGDDKSVLIKEGKDRDSNGARQMIALNDAGDLLWKLSAPRQSSQVSGFVRGDDLVLLFTGKDLEYRSARTGALIASDTLEIPNRQRLFPIQGFLAHDESFVVLGRQLSVRVVLHPGQEIVDCQVLDLGGALSFDGKICALYSTESDSSARAFEIFGRVE